MVGRHPSPQKIKKLTKKLYEKELLRLQHELIKLQEWVKQSGAKIVVVFEGRDAAVELAGQRAGAPDPIVRLDPERRETQRPIPK